MVLTFQAILLHTILNTNRIYEMSYCNYMYYKVDQKWTIEHHA